MAYLVMIAEHLEHLSFLEIGPKPTHGHFELVVVHSTVLVHLEQLEHLFEPLLLLI